MRAEDARESREGTRISENEKNGPTHSSDDHLFGSQPLPIFAFLRDHSRANAFTLLEMLVATAVFSLMIVLLLQLTSGLMSNANRVHANLTIDQEVRILFDLMRRDLAQARIGTNQNQFYGTPSQVSFVSSSSRLKTDYVSDQRLVTYFYESNTIYRAVVEPTTNNYPTVWNPIKPSWWTNDVKANAEALLEGVSPYDIPPYTTSSPYTNPFSYKLRTQTESVWEATNHTNPPSGLTIGFAVASRGATRSGRAENTNERKKMKYDIELNIPPAFNP